MSSISRMTVMPGNACSKGGVCGWQYHTMIIFCHGSRVMA